MVGMALINGSIPMLVLSVLSGGPSYGYEIAKNIKERSEGILEGKEGTLYPLLHKLENKAGLETYMEETAGRIRKYYRITPNGKRVLAKMLADWETVSEAVNKTIQHTKELKLKTAHRGSLK